MEYRDFGAGITEYQEIDIIVSRNCLLRCTYCYLQKKADEEYDMDSIIQTFADTLRKVENKEGIIISLYPEPWVNVKRSNELLIRALKEVYKHKKFIGKFMISLGTSGYELDKPIPIVEHLLDYVSVGVTIDGIKEQHDKYRLLANGSPTWDIVKKNILDNQKKYRIYSTKVTLGPETIKYIFDSTLFLWNEMNFEDVNMNVVFENLWGDELQKYVDLYEEQLNKLSEYVIENRLWEQRKYTSMLGIRNLPTTEGSRVKPYCGAAVMRSIDSDGKLYPCFRLSPYSLHEDKRFEIGAKETDRTLLALNTFDTVLDKCRTCPLLGVCAMCAGNAFEDNQEDSIFWRTTYHCEFVKLNAKYAKKVYDAMNPEEPLKISKEKYERIEAVCSRGF